MVKSIRVKWNRQNNSFMHMFVDTTNIKNLEKQQAINKGQHLMLSSISHEFRTPLNAFSNALELLKFSFQKIDGYIHKNVLKSEKSAEYSILHNNINKYIKIGNISSKMLMSLIEDILDLAKLEAGSFSKNDEPFVIKNLMDEIEDMFTLQCHQKKLEFSIKGDQGIQELTFGSDLGRIKQILMNIISNAFKFTNEGGIYINVSLEQRITNNFDRCRFLIFEIRDTGVGIAQNDIKNLFTMFSMIDKYKNSLNIRGTGLGLTISKKLTEILGGKISVQSQENIGSTFVFDIQESEHKLNVNPIMPKLSGRLPLIENEFNDLLDTIEVAKASAIKFINIHHSKLLDIL